MSDFETHFCFQRVFYITSLLKFQNVLVNNMTALPTLDVIDKNKIGLIKHSVGWHKLDWYIGKKGIGKIGMGYIVRLPFLSVKIFIYF